MARIVDFWAPWCGPCRAIAPIFAEASRTLEPKARFAKVNVDDNQDAARRYGIQGIPALFAFGGGKVAARQAGLSDPNLSRKWVEDLSGQINDADLLNCESALLNRCCRSPIGAGSPDGHEGPAAMISCTHVAQRRMWL